MKSGAEIFTCPFCNLAATNFKKLWNSLIVCGLVSNVAIMDIGVGILKYLSIGVIGVVCGTPLMGCIGLDPGFIDPGVEQDTDEEFNVVLSVPTAELDSTESNVREGSTGESGGTADTNPVIGSSDSLDAETSGTETSGTETSGVKNSETSDSESTGGEANFDPSDLDGLVLWLRADHGVLNEFGNPAADGERVSSWNGQGPNKVSAGPQMGWSTPTYKENALAGHPVLKFDGQSHFIIASSLRIGFVYVVANSDESNSTFPKFAGIFGNKEPGAPNRVAMLFGFRSGDDVRTSVEGDVFTNTVFDRTFLPFDEYKMVSLEQTATKLLDPPIGIGRADFGVETVSSWLGGIAEFIIFDRTLNTSEVADIEGYISNRYQLDF